MLPPGLQFVVADNYLPIAAPVEREVRPEGPPSVRFVLSDEIEITPLGELLHNAPR